MLNKEKPVKTEIDNEKCIKCGKCVEVCPAEYLEMKNETVKAKEASLLGCMQCGYCMINCPEDCIKVSGEGISPEDVISLSENIPGYAEINSLFLQRRSARKFIKQEISKDVLDKIISAAATAPVSIPPWEVKVLVINDFDKVQTFSDEITERLIKLSKIMNPFVLTLFRPLIGTVKYKMIKDFLVPFVKILNDGRKEGKDLLLYKAPAVMVFYGTELTDKEDPIIASTHAIIAAESLGLGTCFIGAVPPAMNDKLKSKYGIEKSEKPAIAFILGYPESKFKKGIKRRFKAVNYY